MNFSNLIGLVSSNSLILEIIFKCVVENLSRSMKVFVIIGFIVVLFLLVLGNFFLVWVVIGDKEVWRKFFFNYLIINMVIVDIFNVFFVLLVFILFLVIGWFWLFGVFGEIICKILYFLVVFLVVVFILMFVVMGLDCFLVVYVIICFFLRKVVKIVIILIWFLVGIFGFLYLYRMGIK